MGEQVVAAAADGVVLGGGRVVVGRVVGGGVVVVTVVGGAVVVERTVEVVVVAPGLTAVGFVALVEDEHAAAPIDKAATATRATRLIIPAPLSIQSRARHVWHNACPAFALVETPEDPYGDQQDGVGDAGCHGASQ
jgi:hypothetical protein